MNFNKHLHLQGTHAILSASNHHWINYTDDQLDRMYRSRMAAQQGTELHAFAQEAIRLGIKLPETRLTMNSYVNDAIGFKMTPEQTLYYSINCYGTADAIGFESRDRKLRIHDLKTGLIEGSFNQLEIYAALFCLEYKFKPVDIDTELRIYQADEIKILEADPDSITHIMSRIIAFDRRITELRRKVS